MKPPRPWFMPARERAVARILIGVIVIAAAFAFYLGSILR
jgi:hypothetical protein